MGNNDPLSKIKIYCPVCRVKFTVCNKTEISEPGTSIICTVCGTKLEVLTVSENEATAKRFPQDPETEIRDRVDTFAKLRGYTFNEDKEDLIEGLLAKNQEYGDFYCPCRFDNIPDNICPCLETRQNAVKKEGQCL